MRLKHFGDSYDVVKQALLRWLAPLGTWAVHPMFTENVLEPEATAFARFLNAKLLTPAQLTPTVDREAYFEVARGCPSHVFLDPDTGLRLKKVGGKKGPSYVFGAELERIATARPDRLVLVFDQSLSRSGQQEALLEKLAGLRALGLSAIAYRSHACFVLAGARDEVVAHARAVLLRESRLPESRVVTGPQNNEMQRTKPAQAMELRR